MNQPFHFTSDRQWVGITSLWISAVLLYCTVTNVEGVNLANPIKEATAIGKNIGKASIDIVDSSIKTGTSVIKRTAKFGTDVGNTVISGGGSLLKGTLDLSAHMANSGIDVIDSATKGLGKLGGGIKHIGKMGRQAVQKGVMAGKKGIDIIKTIRKGTLHGINGGVTFVMNGIRYTGHTGSNFMKKQLDKMSNGVSSLFKGK